MSQETCAGMTPVQEVHGYDGDEGSPVERGLNQYVGNFMHLFLSVLAMLVVAAAVVAVVVTVYRVLPQLWVSPSEYNALHQVLQDILLIDIAGERCLLR